MMAGVTGAAPVIGRRTVAGGTIRAADGGVVEIGISEVACVLMAGVTSARVVVGRGIVTG